MVEAPALFGVIAVVKAGEVWIDVPLTVGKLVVSESTAHILVNLAAPVPPKLPVIMILFAPIVWFPVKVLAPKTARVEVTAGRVIVTSPDTVGGVKIAWFVAGVELAPAKIKVEKGRAAVPTLADPAAIEWRSVVIGGEVNVPDPE
jgi:hypothetical protein